MGQGLLPIGMIATAAQAQAVRRTGGAPRRRRSKSRASSRPRKRRARARRAGTGSKRSRARRGGKFVKGSAAAKRHMARLRKMRRK